MMELQDLSLAGETQLVVVVKLQEIDKYFVELMVVGELLEAYTVSNEKVLHKIVNVVERDNTVEQLERVHDYQLGLESYQQRVNLTVPTLTFPGIKDEELLTITSNPLVGLIYEYSKKEKTIIDIKEILKFCDVTLKRFLEKVKKFNLDVKHRPNPNTIFNHISLVIMSLDCPFKVNLYWGGNIESENGFIKGDKSTLTTSIMVRRKVRYEEFIDLVYAHVGVQRASILRIDKSSNVTPMKDVVGHFMKRFSCADALFMASCGVIGTERKRVRLGEGRIFSGIVGLLEIILCIELAMEKKWPFEIADSFDGLVAISPPLLIEGKNDKVLWRSNNCRHYEFFVSNVLQDIRRRNELKRPNSHTYLLFECDYPNEVWSRLKCIVKLDHAPNSWQAIINFMISKRVSKSIWSILQRLLIGATVYIIWQERNLRIFQGKSRSVDELCSHIRDVIRLRVMSLKLNASFQGFEAANIWEFNVKQINGRGKL
ncbi:hypothetical protein Tco_0778208 [Tanacetum coccineum]